MPKADGLVPGASHVVIPEGIVSSAWPRIRGTCHNIGWTFDPWQDAVGRLILAKKDGGKWASDLALMSIPRQVGKSYLLGCVIYALCLLTPGLRVIWTSHHTATTEEMYEAMKELASHRKVKPLVLKCVALQGSRWRIQFVNGSRVDFGARSQGFGRGKSKVGVLVLDEFQHITGRALANLAPTTNTADNPLILCAGTPPGPAVSGEAFAQRRTAALDGLSNESLYVEFSADEDADPNDRRQWAKANPSFPKRTPERAILLLKKILDEDDFRREALGIWDKTSGGGLISPQIWESLADSGSKPNDPVSFGVYSRNGSSAIGVAGYRADGKIHVGIIPQIAGSKDGVLPGVGWIPPRVKELSDKWRPCAVVIDEKSDAGALIEDIEALNVTIEKVTATKMSNACVKFLAAVDEGQLRHRGTAELQASVCAGKPRDLLDSWAWDRKDRNSDITQLVAVTLALHGLMVNGRPSRSVYEEKDLTVV